MSLADIVAASRNVEGALRGKAQELAGVLLKVRRCHLSVVAVWANPAHTASFSATASTPD
jgi:hypothetical protein